MRDLQPVLLVPEEPEAARSRARRQEVLVHRVQEVVLQARHPEEARGEARPRATGQSRGRQQIVRLGRRRGDGGGAYEQRGE